MGTGPLRPPRHRPPGGKHGRLVDVGGEPGSPRVTRQAGYRETQSGHVGHIEGPLLSTNDSPLQLGDTLGEQQGLQGLTRVPSLGPSPLVPVGDQGGHQALPGPSGPHASGFLVPRPRQ